MIAAEELGVHADDITVISGDTKDTGMLLVSCIQGTAEMGRLFYRRPQKPDKSFLRWLLPYWG